MSRPISSMARGSSTTWSISRSPERSRPPTIENSLFYVVISGGVNRAAAGDFRKAGWRIKPLADYWLLAVSPAPGAVTGACST